ncbi:hypothetical protein KFL_009600020 [Klebsormidium nitens]|uniref:PUB domain-containing protein n=1 Tax=Klebsormidium nitens TaxID=105231 RepID=A0A1Y1ISL4_KLENI|nr:hypothetical protein KFL_009600020 [Klebsormidium nitens]|eukprot:GAQ92261.1 hypothetical protein KFL_009600020 [Klebsormidium nitens]
MEEEETDGSEPMTVDAPLAAPAPGPSEQVPRGSDDAAAGGLEWQRAQEAAAEASGRVQKAVADLRQQAGPGEVTLTLKTLATILRNVMEHPAEAKYRRVRKTNAAFFERVGRFQAALEVLHAAGFREDGASDSMVLQRDDPGLLWLTCSFVEGSLA